MKGFKIEYIDGALVALEIDGQSLIDKAIQALSFTHVQGSRPVLTTTIAEEVTGPQDTRSEHSEDPQSTPTESDTPHPQGRRKRGQRNWRL
ncbi:hypothetical protein [Shimwellia blattae]|uniref:Uncharacterized protein n=1 Tax=Shimwellia blattae (strain ATCC 29907 / DSM 4481 / JCM 1650 / NBRC 105725 / CDC 9005-74) TaxID=630626 RepID=I2B9F2_SHIBC|nr:hypothetical protein [Shimwellia blattae]AFJ47156.1 hypothetical protein EBL_c20650 [Shimwellia blattae DSM 4481 = NBRC 105725]GAB80724.1 hypothetical protein EB105725_08_00090 [Shimwellia blattae DSM 4481 = NBRC 105725]VDY64648.1 Uncharacterised protein [Shimwellia blattae]VEC22755.1 Uncharacterised protein [Shimwellia blattae]